MSSSNFMDRFGPSLLANGYPIIPIQPGTKKPGCYRTGAWRDYPDWTRHATRATTELELSQWRNWPDAGIGIVGGPVAALDIDIAEDAELAHRIEALAREQLGNSPALRIGRPPKRLLVYRAATPFKGIKRHPLEILCLGQQFVGYGIHPTTGRPYEWPDEGLADLDLESLPAIDESRARAFLEEAIALLPAPIRPAGLSSGEPRLCHSQQGTYDAVRAALAFVPNADLDYNSWVRVGMALKGAIGEAGAALFDAWSAQSVKNDPIVTEKAWASFKPRSIGAGTLYHLALERGWKPDPELVLDGSTPRTPSHPAAGLLAKVRTDEHNCGRSKPALALPPPPSLDRLDGVLALLVQHILATSIRPQPWLAVGASLAMLGTLMGRKVRTSNNLRSNLYVIGIAESGGGKDHARKAIKEILVQTGLSHHLGGERLASGSGLISALVRQPSSLFQIDEFGRFLANVVDKRRTPKHLSEIWDLLTELATSAGTTFLGAEYADQRERPRQDVIEPCVCVHGVSAPGPFWAALNSGSLQDGSLARFLVFRSDNDIPDRNRSAAAVAEIPEALLAGVQSIAAIASPPSAGNLAALAAPNVRPSAVTVPMDGDAAAIFEQLDDEVTRRQRDAVGTDQSAVLARVWENTAKVALVKAVSANSAEPVVREIDAQWAREVVEHCVATLLVHAERHIADNEVERCHKRVIELIRGAGERGIRHNEMTRRTQFLDPKLRREILATLIESEQVITTSTVGRGRPGVLYRLSPEHPVFRQTSRHPSIDAKRRSSQ